MSIRELSFIVLAAAIVGCGSHGLDVGSTSGDGAAGAVWNGTLENAQLSNGSNRLTMILSVAPDGAATGTMLLGDGALLPPPSDPNVGYPPGAQFPQFDAPLGFFEGFPYTMLDGHLNGSKLAFGLADAELWARWCSLQKPVLWSHDPDAGDIYRCTSMNGNPAMCIGQEQTDPSGLGATDTCPWAYLCTSYACDCTATACRGSQIAPNLSFDLTISGTTADGTISGELGNHQVRFVRAK